MIPLYIIGFCASAAFYGAKRIEGAQAIPWPILAVSLIFWPAPLALAMAAYRTGRKP